MAIPISDNLRLTKPLPDFERQEYATLADLKSVKDARMPQMYFGYCLETRKYYQYDKTFDIDEVTGRWREFSGGTGAQVTEMPVATESLKDAVLQYVGETDGNYAKGWFYTCVSESHSQLVSITTVDLLKEAIENSSTKVNVQLTSGSTVEKVAFLDNNIYYFIVDDVVYSGTLTGEVVVFDPSTATSYTTDEAVAALGMSYDKITYTYSWQNISVSPSGGEPAPIPAEDIQELFH